MNKESGHEESNEHFRRRDENGGPTTLKRRIEEAVDVPAIHAAAHPGKDEKGGGVAQPGKGPAQGTARSLCDQQPVKRNEQRGQPVVHYLRPVKVPASPRLFGRGNEDGVNNTGHHQIQDEGAEQVVPPLRQPRPRPRG